MTWPLAGWLAELGVCAASCRGWRVFTSAWGSTIMLGGCTIQWMKPGLAMILACAVVGLLLQRLAPRPGASTVRHWDEPQCRHRKVYGGLNYSHQNITTILSSDIPPNFLYLAHISTTARLHVGALTLYGSSKD